MNKNKAVLITIFIITFFFLIFVLVSGFFALYDIYSAFLSIGMPVYAIILIMAGGFLICGALIYVIARKFWLKRQA